MIMLQRKVWIYYTDVIYQISKFQCLSSFITRSSMPVQYHNNNHRFIKKRKPVIQSQKHFLDSDFSLWLNARADHWAACVETQCKVCCKSIIKPLAVTSPFPTKCFAAVLTAEETAFVETLPITLHLLGVVNCPAARCALVASSPVRHRVCVFLGRKSEMIWESVPLVLILASLDTQISQSSTATT